MQMEGRVKKLEARASVGLGTVHVVVRDSPDVTKDEALARYAAHLGKMPAEADTVIYVDVVRTPADIARYDAEGK